MASEQFSLCWDNFHKNMSSGLNALLENEDLVDVTLAVDGKFFKAHQMVLSVCSPYFKELFKANPCQHPIVFLKDVSYVAISDLLQFMYQGEVQVSQDNLTTFIKTAEALQIKGLTGDGNGTDADSEPTPEKPAERHVEETYKPMPRPKKVHPAPIVTTTPAVKKPRLSLSSNDQSTSSTVTKTEPVIEPSQFKVEPFDPSQSVTIPDDGDETFGDDTLDDNTVDDNEDYSMMEGEEPQAGTSTDGAGEGQVYKKKGTETCKYEKPLIPLKRVGTIDIGDGYLYRILKKFKNKRYLKCCMIKELNCKASYVLEKASDASGMEIHRCIATHNHPANELTVQSTRFMSDLERAVQTLPGTTKEIFNHIIEGYPDVKEIYTYSNVIGRMHHWLKKYRRQKKEKNEASTI